MSERPIAPHRYRALLDEALEVCAETGLTPRQLAEQRAELMAHLQLYADLPGSDGEIARRVIAKCEGAHREHVF